MALGMRTALAHPHKALFNTPRQDLCNVIKHTDTTCCKVFPAKLDPEQFDNTFLVSRPGDNELNANALSSRERA